MIIAAPEPRPKRPKKLRPCRYCEASGAGCDSLTWLRGQHCCQRCTGDHHTQPKGDTR